MSSPKSKSRTKQIRQPFTFGHLVQSIHGLTKNPEHAQQMITKMVNTQAVKFNGLQVTVG